MALAIFESESKLNDGSFILAGSPFRIVGPETLNDIESCSSGWKSYQCYYQIRLFRLPDRSWHGWTYPVRYARSECWLRLRGPQHPSRSTGGIVWVWRCGARLDALVPGRQKAIHQIQWVNILNNSCPVRRSSGFRSRPIVLHPVYSGCFPYCRGTGFLHPRVCRWLTTLRSLSCLWYSPAFRSSRSLHRGHGPMDVQQPPQVKCIENRVHLAGLDSPPG